MNQLCVGLSNILRAASIGVVLMAWVGIVLATPTWQVSTVKMVYPQSDASFILVLANDPPTCTSTASPKYLTVQVGQNGVTADGLQSMLATSLLAFGMGA